MITSLTFNDLVQIQKRGVRNGSWRFLPTVDRMYLKVSIIFAKINGKIVNSKVISMLNLIIEKITPGYARNILKVGNQKADELILLYRSRRVFTWAPQTLEWLRNPRFITWLGVIQLRSNYQP